jgi:hypothetical protein
MGLFGRKMKLDVEAPSAPLVVSETNLPSPAPAQLAQPQPRPSSPPQVAFGIENAIQLLRGLPADRNGDIVMRTVKQTLESMGVRIPDVIGDAERKEAVLEQQITAVKADIAELEQMIRSCREEISGLEVELAEATSVAQRLRLGDSAAPAAVKQPAPVAKQPVAVAKQPVAERRTVLRGNGFRAEPRSSATS